MGRSKSNQKNRVRSLGVITGGGDCPGLNAAIRAVFRRANPEGITVYGIRDGFKGLYQGNIRKLSSLDVAGIVAKGGTILGTSRFNPLKDDQSAARIRKNQRRHRIDGLVTIGGEGTMRLSHELHRLGIPTVGIPKTIDNDVWGTDFTFGFDTAVAIATEAIDRLHTTAESHGRIMIVEVMGRHTGWIATYSGMAGGADAILIPEEAFPLSRLIRIVKSRQKMGKRFSIIVVAEDAKILLDMGRGPPRLLKVPTHRDEYGKVQLGGISQLLEAELRKHLPLEIRSTVLGYVQRGGSPTPQDRILATRLGAAAVELLMKGKTGFMVGLKGTKIVSVPLNQVVKKIKTVDRELYRIAEIFFG
jgi:6-phosphofructokinase 1